MQTAAGDSDMNVYSVRWSRNRVVRKPDYPYPKTEPPGSPKTGPPTDVTKEQLTKKQLATLAADFLRSTGYAKPSAAKRERTVRILAELTAAEYTLEEVAAACEIAASLGARGAELIPHVIGRSPEPPEGKVGERFTRALAQEHDRWQSLAERFQALSPKAQAELIAEAKAANPILAKRANDHPLVRAAAVALVGRET